MKVVNIPFYYKKSIMLPKALVKRLPKKVMLFCTVQYLNQLPFLKKQLEQNNKMILLKRLNHCKEKGQILGCNISEIKDDFEAFLYVGEGEFHPKALTQANRKPVFCFNPISKKYYTISSDDKTEKRKSAKIAKFLLSKNIGILLTVKTGQFSDSKIDEINSKYKDKNFYLFINDTYDFSELEDFTFIDCFVNTACPRIGVDDSCKTQKPMVNLLDLLNF